MSGRSIKLAKSRLKIGVLPALLLLATVGCAPCSPGEGAAEGALGMIGGGFESGDPFGLLLGVALAPVGAIGGAIYCAASPGEEQSRTEQAVITSRPCGDAHAQERLGDRYLLGRGVSQDTVQAYVWYSLAASNGRPHASYLKDKLARRMTPEKIAQAGKRVEEWKRSCEPEVVVSNWREPSGESRLKRR